MMQENRILTELDAASGALGFAISTLERVQAGQGVDLMGAITLLCRVRKNALRCSSPAVQSDASNSMLRRVTHELWMTLETLDGFSLTGASSQYSFNSLAC